MDDSTVEWLLEGDPAIRWQVMRDLLHAPPAEVDRERALVATAGWGAELLRRRDPAGTWAGGLYSPKWISTTYTLLLLYRLGLPPDTAPARRGVGLIWDGARYFDGGLTPARSIDAPEACATSMYLLLARYFRYEDPRVGEALRWLLANQLPDGGWNCRTVRFGDRHGSFHTTILALEALAEVEAAGGPVAGVADALQEGRSFFLAHRLYKSHRDGRVVDPVLTMLSFPPRWHYDVLRGLDHFRAASAPFDERLEDAIDLLTSRGRRDGKWPVQHKHSGKVWFDMEKAGGPSRWNTLRAMRVLRWAERLHAGAV